MAREDIERSMRLPGSPGGSPLMDYNAEGGGQMKQQPVDAVETKAVAGQITPPFSLVSMPVEGGVRPDAGPAGSVPRSSDNSTEGGAVLGPAVASAPGGDVFPKGSGTVANPLLPSRKDRSLPAAEIKEFGDAVMPPVAGGYDARFPPGASQLISVPEPGAQPGEPSGLLPRKDR